MSKVICKGKYTSDVKYFLRAVEYSGEKIHMQKIYFTDGRIEDVQDDTMIDFSRYDVRKIEKISFILKDSETHIEMSVEKYQEKIKKPKASIKTSNIIELDDFEQGDSYSECETGFLGYLDYTANRLGAEKEGGMGLFGVGGNIAMDEAEKIARKADEDGVKIYWMNIISISREDGDRLGFNNRQAWKDLIISKAPDIAKAYNISMENFKMYVGFHSNQKNSYHVHLSFHSTSPKDGYIKNGAEGGFEAASEKVKSVVLNTIFKDDITEMKTLINVQRKNILHSLNNAMTNEFISDKLSNSFMFLAEDLKQYKSGKSKYGYLKPKTKELVSSVLKDITEKDIDFKKLTEEYFASCEKQVRFYTDNDEQVNLRMEAIKERFLNPDYHNNDSTAIHNTIIKFANNYNTSDLSSGARATKNKTEFYDLPQEKASDDFVDCKEIPDLGEEKGTMTKIQATKKKIIIRAMCQAVAQMIYSNTRENTSKLSNNNEENKTFSTNKGEFSNKRTNLSSDLTFTNL